MSSVTTSKPSIISKNKELPSQSQQNGHDHETNCIRATLPPHLEGSVYAILIFHVPKLRWLPKYQSLCRSVTIKVTWWGEDNVSATFKPQISGSKPDRRQQPKTTTKYYIRSELKQFTKYLIDAGELLLKVFDTDTNRVLGTVKVQNLSSLSINNSIKGYLPIFANKGDKLGELFVSLRLFLPGPHDSNENFTVVNLSSELNNSPVCCSSTGQLKNDLRTYTLGQTYNTECLNSVRSNDTPGLVTKHVTKSKDALPGMQAYKELPTGKVVEELIERANRLRGNLNTSTYKRKNHSTESVQFHTKSKAENYGNKSLEIPTDDIDTLINNGTVCDMLGIKSSLKTSINLNDSTNSILFDLDGLENEQSLLDDILYGGTTEDDHNKKNDTNSTSIKNKTHSHSKPPPVAGHTRCSSVNRVHGLSNRPRSLARSRSLTRSNDSDTASHISFNKSNSDIDDNRTQTHNENELSTEKIELLNYVRSARIRIDYLRLNILNTQESSSHSSFGRTNKSKRAMTYSIEYQFPLISTNHHGHINEASEVTKITSKRFESNNDIIFSHLSTYPCSFNKRSLKNWWRSLLLFKIYSRMSGTTNPEQIGFAILPLRNILKANHLHFEDDLQVIDRTQINVNQTIPNKIATKFCIGQLHLMLEFDSDEKAFKTKLDRMQDVQHRKSNKTTKLMNNHLQTSKSFLTNESSSDMTDGLVVQMYLSILEARNIPQMSNNNNPVRNPYFVYRAFWNEEPITSDVCWGSSTPRFNFEQKIPILLTKSTIDKMHQNYMIIEIWDKKMSSSPDQIIGIIKIPLEQFYISFKDKQISQVLLRAQFPVISIDSWLCILDPFTNRSAGEIQVLLAMGTSDQITAVQVAHAGGDLYSKSINKEIYRDTDSSLIEHHFEILIESIDGLRAFESMVCGESDCFIQYFFPTQQSTNNHSIKPFQLRTIRTSTTLCTSDPTFHDTNKFQYVLAPTDALHKYFYAACPSVTPIEASIRFEVWSRFYYPNIRDQLLARGQLSVAKLCSMTTMLNSKSDEKSLQSFRIPLEIVKDDYKHDQQHYSLSTGYAGDLSITVTYRRNIVKRNETQVIPSHLSNDKSQVCISVGIIRACGLKYASMFQARHDARFNYPSQVGVNTYAKLTLSFLSDMESRTTRTIARSFIPEFNHTIDFPVPLIWNDHRNQFISLSEILEDGELKIDVYHQMTSNEKQPTDILLCYCRIPLKDLIIRHTGMKGWYPLASANSVVTSETSTDPIEHCVGGIELFARFAQQDDRRHMIESAKSLGWLDEKYTDEENFLDDQKDLGCSVKISIDRIQFPNELIAQSDKDRISVFAQYRLYDKMPIITKRKKVISNRKSSICELQFNKEHLLLCSAPFLWYLREEKLEIQIWISENDTYNHSHSSTLTTDKLLGSIYVDLNSLCNRQRKSHRLSAILPIFKQGTKSFSGACVQIHVTMDKSKHFHELKNPDDSDLCNDVELDSDLENHYLNSINNDRDLRTNSNNLFSVIINIEQAAHLPTIYSKYENTRIPPNPYVTYATADSNHLYRTQVITSTVKPQWNHQQSLKLPAEHLFNERKLFTLKVWHKSNADIESIPEKSGDKALGLVSIDLSPLLSGLQQISGWYNITDAIGNIQGQLKITIKPKENLLGLKCLSYNSKQYQSKLDSYRSTSMNIPLLNINDLSARSSSTSQLSSHSSIINDDNYKPSFLVTNLRRQLGELDVITERLKARYYSNSEMSTTSTTSRNSSASLSSRIMLFNLPIATNPIHNDTDRTHSTTIMQRDLLEPSPRALNERPLVSNDLNITDALSLHNDQVRLAQELMTKANYLLETSKDLFNQSSTPSPPMLPNLNALDEFSMEDTSPHFGMVTEHTQISVLTEQTMSDGTKSQVLPSDTRTCQETH